MQTTQVMRYVAAMRVRNESDVIEAVIRHNLAMLDGIVVVDHGSTDGTLSILQHLAIEGLPVYAASDPTPAFDQATLVNRLVRHTFATSNAEWVFLLDADEFLKSPSRDALRDALDAVRGDALAVTLEWQSYVPPFDADDDVLHELRHARRIVPDRHGLAKIAINRRFAMRTNAQIAKGNHRLLVDGRPVPPDDAANPCMPPERIAIAHVPVRTAQQFSTKVALGWLATLAGGKLRPGESFHWQQAFEYLRSGRPLTRTQLTAFAANYSVPQAQWLPIDAVRMLDEPFLKDIRLRYTRHVNTDPLARVLAHVEALLANQSPR